MDLEPIVPADLRWTDSKFAVVVGGEKVAQLDLTALVTIREARAWSALDRSKCATPVTSNACASIAEYLDQYSGGPHASEAQALLDVQGPTLRKLRDDEVWSKINPAACESAKAKATSPEQIDSNCKPLKLYLAQFHDGQHASVAREALEKARKRREALVAEILRKEKAAQAKEAADARKRCVAECKVGCSSWRINDQALCFSGCVESRCSEGEQ